MYRTRSLLITSGLILALVAGCGRFSVGGDQTPSELPDRYTDADVHPSNLDSGDNTIWTLFDRSGTETTVAVNRYIWTASLEVLDFLPVQSVDPFTGVIVMGFGTPPGGSRAYRATVLVNDPALDARSLSVSLQTRSGPASAATLRAVEDAILTRARQLRQRDSRI